jgi:drug/metabolite transporter (DMT)-like permease
MKSKVVEEQVPGWLATPRSAHIMLSLTALCLAGNHVIGRDVHGEIPPLGLSFWRWMAGAVVLAPLVLPKAYARRRMYGRNMRQLVLLGALIVGSTTLVLVALNFTTAINVSLINATQPVLTVLLATVFLKDRISGSGAAGITAALIGGVIILAEGRWGNLAALQVNGGDLIALLAMFGFSAYALNLKKLPAELSMIESLFAITLAGSLLLLPFYVLESILYMPVPPRPDTVLVVIELALLVSVLGNLMWNMGNLIVGPSQAAMFINLIPVFSAVLAVTFLGESVLLYHGIGALLIGTGIWLLVHGIDSGGDRPGVQNGPDA